MKLKVIRQCIKVIDPNLYVSGTKNVYYVDFEFSEEWDGYDKTAVFNGCGVVINQPLLDGETRCIIPWEVITDSGFISIGVFGTKASEGKEYPTVWSDRLMVDVGCKTGDSPVPPTPDVYAQILEAYTQTNARVDEVEEDVADVKDRLDTVEDELKELQHPYLSLNRLGSYLYEISFDEIPEFIENYEAIYGACSSYVRDGKLYRNLDWNYDNTAEFLVTCKGFNGMAFLSDIEDGGLEGKDDRIGQLPYHINDGVNDAGIMVSSHILFNDFDFDGSGEKLNPIYTIPYVILTQLHDIADIHTALDAVLANIKIPSALGDKLLQFLVTDGETTYVITPSDTGYEIVDASDNPKLTNFKWTSDQTVDRADLQERPVGVERWNTIDEETTLEDLRFTQAYESPVWLSEFIGENGTTKDSTDEELEAIYDIAHAMYLTRTRNGELWQTVHSIVYSDKGIESLCIQENWKVDYKKASGGGLVDDVKVNGHSVVVDKVANVTVPTKMSDLDNDEEYQTADEVESAISTEDTAVKSWVEGKGYSLVSETGYRIDLECDSSTYELKAKLYDKNNVLLSTSTVIDLPIESLIVSIAYDGTTKELVITLKSGATVRVPIGAIISGLATQTWVENYAYDKNSVFTKTEINNLLSDMASKAWVGQQGFLTEHQSLSAYRTSAEQDVIDNALQPKIDNLLATEDKTVIGAINELYNEISGINSLVGDGEYDS